MKVTTVPVKTYITKSKIPGAGYVINPYVGCPHQCLYCYAEFMRKFTGHTEPWGEFLDIKMSQSILHPAQLFHQHVLLSSVTDAYNPFEQKYQITRRILRQLVDCQAYVSILTKSSLVVRDADLLRRLPGCEVTFSLATADESVRKCIEPGASSVPERLKALETLHKAGIPTAVMAAPLLPGISDFRAIVRAALPYTRTFRFDSLNMRATCQHKLMDFVELHYPQLLALYNQIYLQGDTSYWTQLAEQIRAYGAQQGVCVEIFFGRKSSFSFAKTPDAKPNPAVSPAGEPQLF